MLLNLRAFFPSKRAFTLQQTLLIISAVKIVHLYLFSYFCCLFVWIISLFDQKKAKLKARTDFKKTDLIFQVDSSYHGNRHIIMYDYGNSVVPSMKRFHRQ